MSAPRRDLVWALLVASAVVFGQRAAVGQAALEENPFRTIMTGATLAGADLANADLTEAVVKKTKFWGATARRAKAPSGKGMVLALSTMFSKAKEKKTKSVDEKEKARAKRIAQLEAEADKRPPHATGQR